MRLCVQSTVCFYSYIYCIKIHIYNCKIYINYLLIFYKKKSKTLNINKKEKCIEQDRSQKEPDYRESQAGEMRQMVFCDITREHPAEIYSKPGRGLHVTEEAVWLRQC